MNRKQKLEVIEENIELINDTLALLNNLYDRGAIEEKKYYQAWECLNDTRYKWEADRDKLQEV